VLAVAVGRAAGSDRRGRRPLAHGRPHPVVRAEGTQLRRADRTATITADPLHPRKCRRGGAPPRHRARRMDLATAARRWLAPEDRYRGVSSGPKGGHSSDLGAPESAVERMGSLTGRCRTMGCEWPGGVRDSGWTRVRSSSLIGRDGGGRPIDDMAGRRAPIVATDRAHRRHLANVFPWSGRGHRVRTPPLVGEDRPADAFPAVPTHCGPC
jgi:hypothetical protein